MDDQTDVYQTAVYQDLEPRELWRHFAALNQIPRASGEEAAARSYVQKMARASGATDEVDKKGNIVVCVPARGGADINAPVVAVQAHLDMVCEKAPDSRHNFLTDPILPRRRNDCISATNTTLGADNGIGVAAVLALLTTPELRHGPLELVFTVEEETGLHGAMALDAAALRAEMLINLDSEDPDELTIGCAGGAGIVLHLPLEQEAAPANSRGCEIVVSGLHGGHSGVQIHEPLANAIKLLTHALADLEKAGVAFELAAINGGSAHNAIPRDAAAYIVVLPTAIEALESALGATREALRAQWAADEPGFALELRIAQSSQQILTPALKHRVLQLLDALPHGVLQMSAAFPGKVQTSTNLAGIETKNDSIEIACSNRSFLVTELQQTQKQIKTLGIEAGARAEVLAGYPGWEPVANSRLLQAAKAAYETVYGKLAKIEVIHAGLECGVIVSKKPGMEAISFGPLIRGAHTPQEHVSIPTVEPTWKLLTTLLANLSQLSQYR